MANGTSKHWAIVCASRVLPKKSSVQNFTTARNQTSVHLPEPVGPRSRMLLFSRRSSCLLESSRSLPALVLWVLLTPRRDASSAANGGLKLAPRPSPLIWSKSDGMVFVFCYDNEWDEQWGALLTSLRKCLGRRILLHAGVCTVRVWHIVVDSLVVIVYGHRENFFGLFLTHHVFIQVLEDLENSSDYILTKVEWKKDY